MKRPEEWPEYCAKYLTPRQIEIEHAGCKHPHVDVNLCTEGCVDRAREHIRIYWRFDLNRWNDQQWRMECLRRERATDKLAEALEELREAHGLEYD